MTCEANKIDHETEGNKKETYIIKSLFICLLQPT